MSLTVNTNVEALDAQRNLNNTEGSLATAMQRLSSGLRINTAADDVAGYAISQTLQGQINGLNQAQMNTQDATSLSQTAPGSLDEVESMLQRVRELAVQYRNGTNSESSKEAIVSEVGQLQLRDRTSRHDHAVQRHQPAQGSGNDFLPGRRQRR